MGRRGAAVVYRAGGCFFATSGQESSKGWGQRTQCACLGHRGPSLPETDRIRIQKRKSNFFFLILMGFFSDLEEKRHEQRDL